jgi:antitoxin StbD
MYIQMYTGEHIMKHILASKVVSITELREPNKVLEAAGGKPVAILKNSTVVGYLVPEEAVQSPDSHTYATREMVMDYLKSSRERVQPVLDYLRDK